MADVQSNPVSDPAVSAPEPSKAELLVRLDDLLEQYLNTLDKYQKAHEQLASHLTPGYLSLAKANFNNTSRTRYGQDYYDERMQAIRKITVGIEDSHVLFELAKDGAIPNPASCPSPEAKNLTPSSPEENKSEASTNCPNESDAATEDAVLDAATPNKPPEPQANDSSPSTSKPSTDPLRWFGILVPPALRSAQSSFVLAVEGPVLLLAGLVKDLRRLENDVARLRKQIRRM